MGRQPYGDRRDRPPVEKPRVDVQKIMTEGASKEMIEQAEALGQYLVDLKLKTSQIRNIFGTVREIEMSWQADAKPEEVAKARRQLIMLKPKMAYQAAREEQNKKGIGVKELAAVLSPAISLVGDDRARFQNFVDFFEAILAYHTAAGGSN
jgi:CRISPR-associated protein Csm2